MATKETLVSDEQLVLARQIPAAASTAPGDAAKARSAPQAYTRVAIFMHWLVAALILLNLSVGFSMETLANPSPQRNNVLFYHASIGISILALAVFRLGWRLTHQPPSLPQSIPKPQRAAAHGLHWVLYLLVLVQPISGYMHRMAGAHMVSVFGLFNLPVLIGKNEPLRLLTDALHDGGGILLAMLVAGHIGVALKHRWIDRDSVMQRMIPSAAVRHRA
jgi:cytochrome b561